MSRMEMIDTGHLNALRNRIYNIRFAGNWKLLFGSIGYNLYIARQLIKVWGRGNEMPYTAKHNIDLLWYIDKRLEYAECKGALRKLPVNFNTRCRNRL